MAISSFAFATATMKSVISVSRQLRSLSKNPPGLFLSGPNLNHLLSAYASHSMKSNYSALSSRLAEPGIVKIDCGKSSLIRLWL